MSRKFFVWPVLFLLAWAGSPLQARHIIGGVLTYECLGNGDYRFLLKMYRDCNCTQCAEFDEVARIGIYRCSGGDCGSLTQASTFARLAVPIKSITPVDAPDYPCLIPPDVCVEEGIYEFQLSRYNISLPLSDDSYHISYQRCCRNVTINNIIGPGDSGATYTIEITPEAQRLCNNSPVFDNFPPTIICADAPLNFDHSATDPDGDQLVYEFCPPLLGGGPILQGGLYESCDGAQPSPACPPPYSTVTFVAPTYSPVNPMGGDPRISIHPRTGVITGTPNVQGQFVVGVCVSEYRNGVLLSKVFRDFQFNVASCDPTVVADVKEDAVINDKEFLINSCGAYDITFENESYQRQFINAFEWRFNIQGQTRRFTEWSPTVTFPGVGQYNGQLILNPGTDCGDTANIFVNVFPDISADFSYEYDTCVAGPVQFKDLSKSGSNFITGWDWSFGDGNSATRQNPQHVYREPGEIPVTLTVRDTNQCVDQETKIIRYFPVPALLVISPSSFVGCAPADIFFDNLSFPIDETYDLRWDFGDGGNSAEISPWHTFEEPGVYSIALEITSPIGCKTDTVFFELISIKDAPRAGFSFSPENPSNLFPTVQFSDESSGKVAQWFYDFSTGRNSFQPNPVYTFPDTGMYLVRQIVTHPNGCTDTLEQIVDVVPEIRYHLPNAFTPNNDSINDEYKGVGIVEGSSGFEMTIWNRWGEMVFQTSNPDEGWNGRKYNDGTESPGGVYVVLVTFRGPRGEQFQFKGFATLLR